MALIRVLLRKFKAINVRRYNTKTIKGNEEAKRKTWVGISHGFHMVEREGNSEGHVLAQREQIGDLEVWLFGAFDQHMAGGITKYLQSHLFDEKLSERQIGREAKETMRKAYTDTNAKIQKQGKANEIEGSTTVLVMNSQRFVAAHFGGYKVVVCRDGMAVQTGGKSRRTMTRKWSISDMLCLQYATSGGECKSFQKSKLTISAEKVEPDTDFIILASDGVWEVMGSQEAVDLISHIEDAQKAAERLAEEALVRMSKASISCVVIRFH